MEKEKEKKERKPRKPGKRSPGYPMISLDEAIQKAKILWDKDKNNDIPLAAAYEHLGYKSKGGYPARIIAALKKFELISEKQNGIKLTEEAVDLVLHEPSDERYIEIVKKLALKPTIYEKLFNEYKGSLPSDSTLKITLIKDYDFNPESVEDFISSFKKTIEFAGLSKENKESQTEGQGKSPPKKEDRLMSVLESIASGKKPIIEIPIPLSDTEFAYIKIPYPLTSEQWNKIEGILRAYNPTPNKPDIQMKDETQKS
jgi:hypothetical protein